MIRNLSITILLLIFLLTACNSNLARVVTVSEKDAGKTIELKTGQTLVVSLEGNPSTGYTWETENKDLKTLELTGLPEFKAAKSGVAGSPGIITRRFQVVAAGQEPLKLVYHRSWETGVEPAKTFELTVLVR